MPERYCPGGQSRSWEIPEMPEMYWPGRQLETSLRCPRGRPGVPAVKLSSTCVKVVAPENIVYTPAVVVLKATL